MARTHVFISYSHDDKNWLEELQKHLKHMEREGRLIFWDDTKIKPGTNWRSEIEHALATARIVVLLISPDFLASDFIAKVELPSLLEAAQTDGVVILPLIIRPCLYDKTPKLAKFQAVNGPDKALSKLTKAKRDQALADLVSIIDDLLNSTDQNDEKNKNHIIVKLRQQMLTANSVWELRKINYELEEYLARHPYSPDALLIRDQLYEALRFEKIKEEKHKVGPETKCKELGYEADRLHTRRCVGFRRRKLKLYIIIVIIFLLSSFLSFLYFYRQIDLLSKCYEDLLRCSLPVAVYVQNQSTSTLKVLNQESVSIEIDNQKNGTGLAFIFKPTLNLNGFNYLTIKGNSTKVVTFLIEYKIRKEDESLDIVERSSIQSFPANLTDSSTIVIPLTYHGKIEEILINFPKIGDSSTITINSLQLN